MLALLGPAWSGSDYRGPAFDAQAKPKAGLQLTLQSSSTEGASGLGDSPSATSVPDAKAEISERAPSGGTEPRRDALITLPIERYFTTDELSVPPNIGVDMPERIEDSWPLPRPGKLVLKLYLDENGQVDRISIDESDLPIAFEALAIAAFRSGIFSPGQLEGRRVKSQIKIQIDFASEAGTSQTFSPGPSVVGN